MSTFCIPQRVETGFGSLLQAGNLLKFLGGNKALIVMDAFLASSQLALDKKVTDILKEAAMESAVYAAITGEPTSANVAEAVDIARKYACDCVLAVGGGSSIDTAKAVAVKALNPDLALKEIPGKAYIKRLPLVAAATTAGTGSEATKVTVITNLDTGIKENPGHPAIVPDIAILDPALTMTLPQGLTAFTGMDALTHAMEAYVSNKATEMTDFYALTSMRIIGNSLEKVWEDGSNKEERQNMSIASYYAGIAFSNASTNLAHAAGRALGAAFHIPHGLSVALFLPFVMEFGLFAAKDKYARVAIALGAKSHESKDKLARQAVEIVYAYNEKFGVWEETRKKYIKDFAAYRQQIPEMVKNTLAGNGILTNPIVPGEAEVTHVFEKLGEKLQAGC